MAWLVQQDGTSFIVQQDGTSRLLLNDVAAAPTPAVRVRPAALSDSGHIEARGLVRLGLVVAAVVVAATPAIRITGQLEQPTTPVGRVSTGYAVTAAPVPTPTPAIRIAPEVLDDPAPIVGRVAIGWPVAAPVAPAATPALRISATLPTVDALVPRVASAITVAPVVTARTTSTLPDTITPAGRVSTGYVVVRPATPAIRITGQAPDAVTFAGRVTVGYPATPTGTGPVIPGPVTTWTEPAAAVDYDPATVNGTEPVRAESRDIAPATFTAPFVAAVSTAYTTAWTEPAADHREPATVTGTEPAHAIDADVSTAWTEPTYLEGTA